MKRIAILIFVALIACSKDDPGPTYTDIAGSWNIQSATVNGTVDFAKHPTNGSYYAYNDKETNFLKVYSDSFSVTGNLNGIGWNTDMSIYMDITGTTENLSHGSFSFKVSKGSVSKDFKTITVTEYIITKSDCSPGTALPCQDVPYTKTLVENLTMTRQ